MNKTLYTHMYVSILNYALVTIIKYDAVRYEYTLWCTLREKNHIHKDLTQLFIPLKRENFEYIFSIRDYSFIVIKLLLSSLRKNK